MAVPGLPIVIMYIITDKTSADGSMAVVLAHISVVLALQTLGTVRAAQSWQAQVSKGNPRSRACYREPCVCVCVCVWVGAVWRDEVRFVRRAMRLCLCVSMCVPLGFSR